MQHSLQHPSVLHCTGGNAVGSFKPSWAFSCYGLRCLFFWLSSRNITIFLAMLFSGCFWLAEDLASPCQCCNIRSGQSISAFASTEWFGLERTFKGHRVQPLFAKLKKVFVIMNVFLIWGDLLWPFSKFSALFLTLELDTTV